MSFSSPLFLLGLLGASVPIIIHLIHRKKPRRVSFAAITFVLKSIEKVSRKLRLRKFLLLAARVLILALFSFAAARPYFGDLQGPALNAQGPEAIGIVVDASLSMRATYEGRSAFKHAIDRARAVVDRMSPEDLATIVVATSPSRALLSAPTSERSALVRKLSDLEPSLSTSDLGEAVTLAVKELTRGRTPENRIKVRIVVLSDLAGHAFKSPAELSGAAIELIDVLEHVPAAARVNHAVTEVSVAPARGRGARTVAAHARVRAFSASGGPARPVAITMTGPDGDLVPSTIDLVPGTTQDKSFTYAFEDSGIVPIAIVLEPDVLAEDDVRHAIAHVQKQVRPLVVDGAPSGVPKEDEIFYFERALLAGAEVIAPPAVVTADDLGRTDLLAYDVVILAGVQTISVEEGARLTSFVEKGGGLFISVAPGLDVAAYEAALSKVLPRHLRGEKRLGDIVGSAPTLGLRVADPLHPISAVFQGEAKEGLETTETSAYLLLEPSSDQRARTLLAYDDGQPALMATSFGAGRVLLLTTTVDREFSDLPIRPAFLPLVERSIAFLGNALAKPDTRRTLIGESRTFELPDDVEAVEITDPNKKKHRLSRASGASARFDATYALGTYFVSVQRGGHLERFASEDFVVNVDASESDLSPLSVEEATTALGANESSGQRRQRFVALAGTSQQQLSSLLLVLVLIAFLLESGLSATRDPSTKS
ncbi:MAG: BatA domain-containing protein [Deltaproteobacteria bacterium]|nr:BatA domain-containing protein [Deltaproteobacteria bacterium]